VGHPHPASNSSNPALAEPTHGGGGHRNTARMRSAPRSSLSCCSTSRPAVREPERSRSRSGGCSARLSSPHCRSYPSPSRNLPAFTEIVGRSDQYLVVSTHDHPGRGCARPPDQVEGRRGSRRRGDRRPPPRPALMTGCGEMGLQDEQAALPVSLDPRDAACPATRPLGRPATCPRGRGTTGQSRLNALR
jgi:hypothetical protein